MRPFHPLTLGFIAVVVTSCRSSRVPAIAATDSARAIATAFRLAGSDVPSDFHVLSFARDSAGYLIVLGPNLVATNARGDTVGYTVGGRVTVRVAPSGVGTVLFRSQ